jgi:hypothetical protein
MRLMQNRMQIAAYCAHIDALNKKAKDSEQKDFEDTLMAVAPIAKTKLATKHGDFKALAKIQICALMFSEYQTLEKESETKHTLVELLKAKIAENPRSLAVPLSPPASTTVII